MHLFSFKTVVEPWRWQFFLVFFEDFMIATNEMLCCKINHGKSNGKNEWKETKMKEKKVPHSRSWEERHYAEESCFADMLAKNLPNPKTEKNSLNWFV